MIPSISHEDYAHAMQVIAREQHQNYITQKQKEKIKMQTQNNTNNNQTIQEIAADTSWLDEEISSLGLHNTGQFETLPSLKLIPNKIITIDVDINKPFQTWNGESGGKKVVKKIIPCLVNGVKYNFWLNIKNPIYKQMIEKLKTGQTTLKLKQTGTAAETKYTLLED